MQDRLVKELPLEGISTVEAANAFMPAYVADYNDRFGKVPRDAHDAHRPVRPDEDLDSIFAWREQRKVKSDAALRTEALSATRRRIPYNVIVGATGVVATIIWAVATQVSSVRCFLSSV
jgi:hypothetical protein